MIQKIIQSGEKKLRIVSKPVNTFDKKIVKLIQDLRDTLQVQVDPEGVGLAAPQIGVNLRVFAVSWKSFKRIVINPEIISKTQDLKNSRATGKKAKNEILEGCLSLPHYYGPLKREQQVKLKYVDENFQEQIETFEGFKAQIIMHEIDHLNGVLFVDRLLQQNQKLYKLDENDEWEEIEI